MVFEDQCGQTRGETILRWTPTGDLSRYAAAWRSFAAMTYTGSPLFGSPPVTAEVEAKYRFGDDWTAGARYMHRWTLDRPGFEEVARGAVDVVDAEVNYDLGGGLDVGIYAQNLFDENYFGTADALSALAPERSRFGVRMTWRRADRRDLPSKPREQRRNRRPRTHSSSASRSNAPAWRLTIRPSAPINTVYGSTPRVLPNASDSSGPSRGPRQDRVGHRRSAR
ncbi:MAG: TonB-dependent receptor [Rhodanobacteraceae bacterium]|nr:TonB-dependent receptor [Rhodanobacteraceae bacterium]